jgi:hypothetical protein
MPLHTAEASTRARTTAPVVPATGSSNASPGEQPFALLGISKPDFGAAGPIQIKGYPEPLSIFNNDAATYIGFTPTGEVGFCYSGCCFDDGAHCNFYDGANTLVREFITPAAEEMRRGGSLSKAGAKETKLMSKAQVEKSGADAGLTAAKVELSKATQSQILTPPKLEGDWAYASDIRLVVGGTSRSGSIGGAVGDEAPVFPIDAKPPEDCAAAMCFFAGFNLLALSPDRTYLGVIEWYAGHSHYASFSVRQLATNALAAAIYNDTGFRHHSKGRYEKATLMFTKAVYADPTKSVFAYNLASALARQKDKRAESPLAHAIAKGGISVKARALKDKDFFEVRSEPWFISLTATK